MVDVALGCRRVRGGQLISGRCAPLRVGADETASIEVNVNEFEAKQEARRDRLNQAADSKTTDATRQSDSARNIGALIPLGQPILVGHHSQRRHENAIKKIDRAMRASVDASKDAVRLRNAAASVGTGGISSDDPDAIEKLRTELGEAEGKHAALKAARKQNPDGVGAYQLTNSSARIRDMKKRVAELEAKRLDVTSERTIKGVRVVDNVEANRLQLHFPDRPSCDVVAALKSCGFRWTPSLEVWQRHRSAAANYAAEHRVLNLI